MPTSGIIYLIPTILAEETAAMVIPAQVAQCISGLDYFMVENARTARRYIKTMAPEKVIESLQITVIDKNASEAEVKKAL